MVDGTTRTHADHEENTSKEQNLNEKTELEMNGESNVHTSTNKEIKEKDSEVSSDSKGGATSSDDSKQEKSGPENYAEIGAYQGTPKSNPPPLLGEGGQSRMNPRAGEPTEGNRYTLTAW